MAACGQKKKEVAVEEEKVDKKDPAPKAKFGDVATWVADHSIVKGVVKGLSDKDLKEMTAVKTSFGWTLEKACITAVKLKQHVGVYAGDAESYTKMDKVFNKVIDEYHNLSVEENKASEETYEKVDLPKLEDAKAIVSTRIRTARNMKSLPFTVNMTKDQRVGLENLMKKVFATKAFQAAPLKGKYYPMVGMKEETRKDLVDKHFLYINDDPTLELVGCYDDWPQGRGIYINDEENHKADKSGTFIVWVGEEDQLRIMAMNKGSDVQKVWNLFYSGVEAVHKAVKEVTDKKDDFLFSKTHGYLSSCPTNIGTGMRASVHVDLPGFKTKQAVKDWVAEQDKNNKDGKKMMIDIRGTRGEATNTDGCTRYDVSNKARLGSNCVEQITCMVNGVKALLAASKKRQEA